MRSLLLEIWLMTFQMPKQIREKTHRGEKAVDGLIFESRVT